MKRMITALIIWITLAAFGSQAWAKTGPLQAEPAMDEKVTWHTEPNGMLTVGYDLDHNGRPDFYTVRVVVVHFFSMEPLEQIAKYHPGLQVFQVVYPYASYFYVTQSQPLFYAVDEDEDGRWDTVFKDIQEDGINGNEVAWNNVAFHANR